MSTRVFFILIAAVAVAALVAGCGGGDDSEATASRGKITVETGSLSKAEFTKRADEICEKTEEQFFRKVRARSERVAEHRTIDRKTQYGIYASVIDSLFYDMARQIAALGAPAGDEKKISKLVNAVPRDIDVINAAPIQAFADGTPLSETLKLVEAYGLDSCVESLT